MALIFSYWAWSCFPQCVETKGTGRNTFRRLRTFRTSRKNKKLFQKPQFSEALDLHTSIFSCFWSIESWIPFWWHNEVDVRGYKVCRGIKGDYMVLYRAGHTLITPKVTKFQGKITIFPHISANSGPFQPWISPPNGHKKIMQDSIQYIYSTNQQLRENWDITG